MWGKIHIKQIPCCHVFGNIHLSKPISSLEEFSNSLLCQCTLWNSRRDFCSKQTFKHYLGAHLITEYCSVIVCKELIKTYLIFVKQLLYLLPINPKGEKCLLFQESNPLRGNIPKCSTLNKKEGNNLTSLY